MTDDDLIARLRSACYLAFDDGTNDYQTAIDAADRIEALVKERDRQYDENVNRIHQQALAENRAERLEAALREIAAEASVTVHTWKNGINFKKMYEGWRKIAVERIDIARAALKGADHDRA